MPICGTTPEEELDGDPLFVSKQWLANNSKWDKLLVHLIKGVNVHRIPGWKPSARPLVTVDIVGTAFTGSTDRFPLGTETFRVPEDPFTDVCVWDQKRMVGFLRGSAKRFRVRLVDQALRRKLLDTELDIPMALFGYRELKLPFPGAPDSYLLLRVKLVPHEKKAVSAADLQGFPLREHPLEVEVGGETLRSLVAYHTEARNDKAVLWILGRADLFFHPHVGKLLSKFGYDVYVLNYHNNGLCRKRRYMTNPYLVSHVETGGMEEFHGEIDAALDFIHAQKKHYKRVLAYAFSTGGPILVNYLHHHGDDRLDGFIFNSPFLDFDLPEVIEKVTEQCIPPVARYLARARGQAALRSPSEPTFRPREQNAGAVRTDLMYEQDPEGRPFYRIPVTLGFTVAAAATHALVLGLRKPLTNKPTVVFTSKGDNVLSSTEIVALSQKVVAHGARTLHQYSANNHDVFVSVDPDDSKAALKDLEEWLKGLDKPVVMIRHV